MNTRFYRPLTFAARVVGLVCATTLHMYGCRSDAPVEPAGENVLMALSGNSSTAPTGVTAIAVSASRIDVSWRDNSTNETGFEVYRATAPATVPVALLVTTAANVSDHGDAGLTPSTGYCYAVRSFRVSGRKTSYSAYSTSACATTPTPPPPPVPPAAPSSVDATPAGSTGIHIDWAVNSTTEDGFRVERSLDGGTTWIVAASGPNTHLFDWGRASEVRVCYRVVAFNAYGDSPPSEVDCTTPPAAATNLVIAAFDPLTSMIELTWTDNSAVEDSYELFACEDYGICYLHDVLPADATRHQLEWDGFAVLYFLVARSDDGQSDSSNEARVIPPAGNESTIVAPSKAPASLTSAQARGTP